MPLPLLLAPPPLLRAVLLPPAAARPDAAPASERVLAAGVLTPLGLPAVTAAAASKPDARDCTDALRLLLLLLLSGSLPRRMLPRLLC